MKETKKTKKEQTAQNEECVSGEVEEQNEKFDIGIKREGLDDEQYITALEEKLALSMQEATTCKALAQRLQADFDNYRRRNNSIIEDMKKLGESIVIEKLLSVLDNCDLARKYIQDEASLMGFNMMETQILNALDSFGLKEVDALDQDFDAKFMSAVEREKCEGKDGKVLEVQSKGYTLNGKLLRPASVKVGYWE